MEIYRDFVLQDFRHDVSRLLDDSIAASWMIVPCITSETRLSVSPTSSREERLRNSEDSAILGSMFQSSKSPSGRSRVDPLILHPSRPVPLEFKGKRASQSRVCEPAGWTARVCALPSSRPFRGSRTRVLPLRDIAFPGPRGISVSIICTMRSVTRATRVGRAVYRVAEPRDRVYSPSKSAPPPLPTVGPLSAVRLSRSW